MILSVYKPLPASSSLFLIHPTLSESISTGFLRINTRRYISIDLAVIIQLKGHTQGIRGIAFPLGSNTIFTASRNGIVHIWDSGDGRLLSTVNLDQKIGCLIGFGPWIFIGLHNSIKIWNVLANKEYTLGRGNECSWLVFSMACNNHLLFSGAQDGSISAWMGSYDDKRNPFKVAAPLKGHTAAVTCLCHDSGSLCSGSSDGSIRVWDLKTFKCLHTLKEHADVVMSVLYWNEYLLLCSLDKTIKVWACAQDRTVQVVYTHDLKRGVICLKMYDQEKEKNPVLLCSLNDGCVSLFDFPSFQGRGRVISKDEARRIETKDGLGFIGDEIGTLAAWEFAKSKDKVLHV